MTTPAERLRRALPPKPKGGYEPGTVAADTAAVLDDNTALRAALDNLTKVYDSAVPYHEEIAALRAKLDMPCGSCHPCVEWAAETWRRTGGPLPHKVDVDEWKAERDVALATLEQVKALHKPAQVHTGRVVSAETAEGWVVVDGEAVAVCGNCHRMWPCPTIAALSSASEGETL